MNGYTFREGGYDIRVEGTSTDSGKDQFANAASATPVHFDTNQVRLPTQPVNAADTTFPATHNRAALLVRTRNLALGLASVTESLPFLRGDTREEGRVNCIEHIQIRNDIVRDGGARVGALEPLARGRGRTGLHDDRPWEFV
jgi:hypothetical protein